MPDERLTVGEIARRIGRSSETVRLWGRGGRVRIVGKNARGEALFSLAEVAEYARRHVSDAGHGGKRPGAGRKAKAGTQARRHEGTEGGSHAVTQSRSDGVAGPIFAVHPVAPVAQVAPVAPVPAPADDQDDRKLRARYVSGQMTDEELADYLVSGKLTAADIDLFHAAQKAMEARLTVQQKNGRLVDVGRVRVEVGRQFKRVRETLDQLTGLLVPRLATALKLNADQVREVREIIVDQIQQARRELARAEAGDAVAGEVSPEKGAA